LFSNTDKGKTLSNNAFEIVTNYDWDHIGQKYINIYQKVLA